MKLTINKRVYHTRGILGGIGTLLMMPGFVVAMAGGFLLAILAMVLILPGALIALITAERER